MNLQYSVIAVIIKEGSGNFWRCECIARTRTACHVWILVEAEKAEAELEERCSGVGREILGADEDQDCDIEWSWATPFVSV